MRLEGGKRRLFFALWPEEAVREALLKESRGWVKASGGRPMRRENIHLTLAFLGNVDEAVARCVQEAAAKVSAEPFDLPFERYGYFSRPRVFWSGPRETPTPLVRLVAELNAVLEPCGIHPEKRPFKAHLTLARKARPPKGEWRMSALPWRVESFVLVESLPSPEGVRYEVIGRWGLGEAAGDRLQATGKSCP